MKTLKTLVCAILVMVLTINTSMAQNYKAPKIDASGKITDKNGKYIGKINQQGEIMDTMGTTIAHIDGNGMLVDPKTGKHLGKAEKNGNYLPHFPKTSEQWTTSAPMNGTCLVKNEKGEVVAEVHENYKQFGACAIHCLENHMNHNEVLEKKEDHSQHHKK